MLKVIIVLAVVLRVLFLFFPDQMEDAVDEVQDTVESVADDVGLGGGGEVSLAPSDTTDLELTLLVAAAAENDARSVSFSAPARTSMDANRRLDASHGCR